MILTFPDNSIRLVDGRSSNEGRVEVYYNNEWGTVCDKSWYANDAEVVCRQLGFPVQGAYRNAYFGEGSENVLLHYVACFGSESALSECPHGGWGTGNCEHREDAGVVCGKHQVL